MMKKDAIKKHLLCILIFFALDPAIGFTLALIFYCPGSTQSKSSYELNQSVLSCIDRFMIGRGHQVLLTR